MTDKTYISPADTAKLARADLKRVFPGVKFSVRTSTYSGGASIDVAWVDGPTETEVKAVVGQYEGASFDGMIDLKSYHDSYTMRDGELQRVHYQADYIFFSRRYSREFLTGIAEEQAAKYNKPYPEIKDDGHSAYIESDGELYCSNAPEYEGRMRQIILKAAGNTSAYKPPANTPTAASVAEDERQAVERQTVSMFAEAKPATRVNQNTKPKWRVRWMDRNMEPPYPCGLVMEVVQADTRQEAIDKIRQSRPVSSNYPVTCSKVRGEVTA